MHTSTGYIASHAVLAAVLAKNEVEGNVVPIEEKNLPAHRAQEFATTGVTKIRRNEPCPCGSGKKFKRCHFTASSEMKDRLLGLKLAGDLMKEKVD